MKYLDPKLTYSQESNKFPTFPHRKQRKQIPCVGDKTIPVHKLQVNRAYQCQMNTHLFERWAFVPTQTHKLSDDEEKNSLKSKNINKSLELRAKTEFQSTSKLFLKRYLKRKDKKIKADTMYYSLAASQKSRLLEKRKSFFEQRISKSFTQLKQNPYKTQVQQNWPEITVKSLTQNCKMYKKKQKKTMTEQIEQENNCNSNYLSKYLQSDFTKALLVQQNKDKQEISRDESKNPKMLKFKIMQKRRRCIKNLLSTQDNSDM